MNKAADGISAHTPKQSTSPVSSSHQTPKQNSPFSPHRQRDRLKKFLNATKDITTPNTQNTALGHATTNSSNALASLLMGEQKKSDEMLIQTISNLSPQELSKLPHSDPNLLHKIIIFSQLKELFENITYEKQKPLFRHISGKIPPETEEVIKSVIFHTRQAQQRK